MMTYSTFLFPLLLLVTFNPTQAATEQSTEEPIFTVTPPKIWSKPLQVHQFTVTGGLPPIYWQTQAGEVTVGEEPNTFIYQAPRRYMQDTILFFDRAGQEIQVTIDVLRPLRVSPSVRHIPINGETRFRIYGGSGSWQTTPDEILTVSQSDNSTLIVKAGAKAGIQNIQIHDPITHEQLEVQVHVYAPLEVLSTTD